MGCGPGVALNSGVDFDLIMIAGFAISWLTYNTNINNNNDCNHSYNKKNT